MAVAVAGATATGSARDLLTRAWQMPRAVHNNIHWPLAAVTEMLKMDARNVLDVISETIW
jgi:hypothetical protein